MAYLRQPPTIPPIPAGMAFVDRVTGERWLLTSVGGNLAIENLDDIPWVGYDFKPHSEVDFVGPTGPIRVSMRAGKLVFEEVTSTRRFAPVLTRPRSQSAGRIFEIFAIMAEFVEPSGPLTGDWLGVGDDYLGADPDWVGVT